MILISLFLKKKESEPRNHKYIALYKCQLCNTEFQYGDAHEIPYDVLPELLARVVKDQMMIGNPYLYQAPMYIPHKCKSGHCGNAVFVGFYKIN